MDYLKIKTSNIEWKRVSLQSMPEIDEYVSFHRYKKNQVIFYAGHMPYGLFILVSGKVEISYPNNDLRSGKTEIISGPALLGALAIKDKIPLSSTFKALSDCEINFLSFSVYRKLKGTENPLAKWINKYI